MNAHRLRIGIAGAGVLGRLLAWQLSRAGHVVTVFDPAAGPEAPATGSLSEHAACAAGFTAAGMLSPIAELDNAGPDIARLGWRSLALWREVADTLRAEGCSAPLFEQHGSLILAHSADLGAARRVLARLDTAPSLAAELPAPQPLDRAALAALEPALAPGLHAWLLPGEAQVMSRDMLHALAVQAPNVHWCWGERVERVAPGVLQVAGEGPVRFDLAIDVRGVNSRPDLAVRGVRGEVIWLHAPGVQLQRPVRLLHPRHRVYIVPRPGDLFVVGASEVESEDRSPVSLRSAVELMAAAQSVLPELAEARIVHMEANLRPALPDNEPHTHTEPGLLRINGLFRHGWLLAPALVQDALARLGHPPAPLRGFPPPVPEGGHSLWPGQARSTAVLDGTLAPAAPSDVPPAPCAVH
ncbi:FAD-dependent oxidoreductase [Hydrogenophaga taeniospiralis]|uniref:FAD-dependent oxidoreductase n=1 Tax=Hydrogenophaga taeniospiralis TaxID=65656 RepID=UPI001CFAB02B|nr:FAD-dependent oxidoreductase [Hydrogenophaga taeniospiralis]UCU93260.1 FAD-dependent oxidoreductase [Hydrogenophaga taeniospiralis]